jgi:hypothetical protein
MPWKMYYVSVCRAGPYHRLFLAGTGNLIAVYDLSKRTCEPLLGMPDKTYLEDETDPDRHKYVKDTIISICAHRMFSDGNDILITEKDVTVRIGADES